jgi:hypothetical protein
MDSRLKVPGRFALLFALALAGSGCAHKREVVYPAGSAAPAALLTPMPAGLGASKQMPVAEVIGPATIAPTLQIDGPH